MPALHEIIKNKKSSIRTARGVNGRYNHPHRLEFASVSGDIDYTIDERSFSTPPTNPDVYVFDLSLDSTSDDSRYTRIFQDKYPWLGGTPPVSPDQGEFVMAHRPLHSMWGAISTYGSRPDSVLVGTLTKTHYTSGVPGTPVVTDIFFDFVFFLSVGGFPASGGKDVDAEDEKCEFEFNEAFTGTDAGDLPNFFTVVTRLPWDENWSSETAAFSTIMTDYVAAGNAADGGGHSGSTSLSLDFTNQT